MLLECVAASLLLGMLACTYLGLGATIWAISSSGGGGSGVQLLTRMHAATVWPVQLGGSQPRHLTCVTANLTTTTSHARRPT